MSNVQTWMTKHFDADRPADVIHPIRLKDGVTVEPLR